MRCLPLLLVMGCGDNTIPTLPYEARSGARIELRIYQYSDGTQQWDPNVYYDRELQERCAIQRWSDGYTYCTPTARSTVYTDPSCESGELGRWLATQPPPDYFYREHTLIGADVISRVFRRSGATPAPAQVYEISGGRCVETPAAGWTYFVLGDEIPRAGFARIKHLSAEGRERLGMDVYVTDDGLYVPVWSDRPLLRDRVLDNECRVVERPNSPTATCEPVAPGEAEFSRDSQCAAVDVLVVEASAPVPDVVVRSTEGCRSYARRGAEIPHVPLFLPIGDSCVSVQPPPDAHLFEIGAPFDVPVLAREHEPSERRLQRILMTDGETTVVDSLLFDRELGVDCTRTLVGGTYRCIPAHTFATVVPYFRDPACVEPIDISLVLAGGCDPPTRFAIDHRSGAPAVRPLLAPFAGKLFEISTADTCLEYIPPRRQVPFTVGAAVPPEMFVDAILLD